MKTLLRQHIPEDFVYYRTGSRVFYDHYANNTRLVVGKAGRWHEFFTAYQIFPGFWSINHEKHDTELSDELLASYGIRHGIIFWAPLRLIEKPAWYHRLPTWYTKRSLHSSRSAFSILDTEEYWNKWSSKARAHRRHVLENIEKWVITIERQVPIEDFLEYYQKTKLHDPNQKFVSYITKKLFAHPEDGYRAYFIRVNGEVLAGAVFIDEGTTSEYWASFYHDEGHPYRLGIAMMDAWFLDSYRKWIKYCDLDHMRDTGQSSSYAGYTKFKESIAEYDVFFHDMWVKIF